MSKHKKIRFIIHYVKPTAQLLFKIRFSKGGPTCKWLIHDTKRRKDNQLPQGKIKEEIKMSYNQYMNSLFEDENLGKPYKKFWKAIKAKRRDQAGVPPLMKKDGKLESSSKGKAQVLNAQYTSVFREEDISNIPTLDMAFTPAWVRSVSQ